MGDINMKADREQVEVLNQNIKQLDTKVEAERVGREREAQSNRDEMTRQFEQVNSLIMGLGTMLQSMNERGSKRKVSQKEEAAEEESDDDKDEPQYTTVTKSKGKKSTSTKKNPLEKNE
jgi:hypothetical protein